MSLLSSLFFPAYGALWRAAHPFLRRHKRLAQGFDERLVPDGWPHRATADAQIQTDGQSAGGLMRASEQPDKQPDKQPGRQPGRQTQADGQAKPRTAPRIWIQAASGGESRLVQGLVAALGQRLSAAELLCTTCTRQGLDILESLPVPPGFSLLPRYLPLDRPDIMDKAMAQAAPDVLALLETELWPGLLRAAKQHRVPVLVLNARMTEKSRKAYAPAAALLRELAPDRVLAISEADAARFASLFQCADAVGVMPNIKFDLAAAFTEQSFAPLSHAQAPGAGLRRDLGLDDSTLLALFASVREEEEEALLPVLAALYGKTYQGLPVALPVALAVAPRHMHRLNAWRQRLEAHGMKVLLRSEAGRECPGPQSGPQAGPQAGLHHDSQHDSHHAQQHSPQHDSQHSPQPVILCDRFGEMQGLYGAADAAFVGGSLTPLGGQNYLEAPAQGLRPFVGPHTENFAWVGEDIFTRHLARRVFDASALLQALECTLAQCAQALSTSTNPAQHRYDEKRATQALFCDFLAPHRGGCAMAADALVLALSSSCR